MPNDTNEAVKNESNEKNLGEKKSFFKNVGQGVVKFTKNKINEVKEATDNFKDTMEGNKILKKAFEEQSKIFTIKFRDATKKDKKIHCIIDENNNLLKTDVKIMPNEVKCLLDSLKQEFYIIIIKDQKFPFNITYKDKEYKMELSQIKYENKKATPEVSNIYNIDYSIKAEKGAIVGENNNSIGKKAVVGENNTKETNINANLKIPKL